MTAVEACGGFGIFMAPFRIDAPGLLVLHLPPAPGYGFTKEPLVDTFKAGRPALGVKMA